MTQSQPLRPTQVDAVIVGAGFSGLYALYRLRALGFTTRTFDAADGVGGTWYWNRYPGARCDSESHYYCYSFSEEIRNEWIWSCRYPAQPEILSYLNFVADKLDLKKHIDFGTRIVAGNYDEGSHSWLIETDAGETVQAKYLVTGVGNTSTPARPDIPGLDGFTGEIYHTALWPQDGVDFSGKRVGLVGTGSSGIQCTPLIAEQAEHLTVFQRTASYSVPARNFELTEEMRRKQLETYDDWRQLVLASPIGMSFPVPTKSVMDDTPEQRKAKLDELWEVGGFRFMFTGYNDVIVNKDSNDVFVEYISAKIRETVKDPAKADVLCQFNHPAATKRPPLDTNYYEAFNRDNVGVVNIRANPVREATTDGLTLTDGTHYTLDAIVFATGFDTVTGTLLKMNLSGKGGQSLADKWQDGPRAYLGLCSQGFPNLFMITGPGTPGTLTNFPGCIEQNVDWIAGAMTHMRDTGATEIEASAEAETEWVESIIAAADQTLYPTVDSWYMNSNLPGKPRVFTAYLGGMPSYTAACDDVARNDYKGFALRSPAMADAG